MMTIEHNGIKLEVSYAFHKEQKQDPETEYIPRHVEIYTVLWKGVCIDDLIEHWCDMDALAEEVLGEHLSEGY